MRTPTMTSKRGAILHTGTGVEPVVDQTLNRLTVDIFKMSEPSLREYASAVSKLTGLKYTQVLNMFAKDIGYESWDKYREVRPSIHRDDDGKDVKDSFDIIDLGEENILLKKAHTYISDSIKCIIERRDRNTTILEKVTSKHKFGIALKHLELAEKNLAWSYSLKADIEGKLLSFGDTK